MDSFDVWGASLCWSDEAIPQSQELDQQNTAEDTRAVPRLVEELTTQDILEHEASLDCGALPFSWQVLTAPIELAPPVTEAPCTVAAGPEMMHEPVVVDETSADLAERLAPVAAETVAEGERFPDLEETLLYRQQEEASCRHLDASGCPPCNFEAAETLDYRTSVFEPSADREMLENMSQDSAEHELNCETLDYKVQPVSHVQRSRCMAMPGAIRSTPPKDGGGKPVRQRNLLSTPPKAPMGSAENLTPNLLATAMEPQWLVPVKRRCVEEAAPSTSRMQGDTARAAQRRAIGTKFAQLPPSLRRLPEKAVMGHSSSCAMQGSSRRQLTLRESWKDRPGKEASRIILVSDA